MIWSYIPIFLIICSFIFFIFFHTLTEQNKRSTAKANEVSTAQILQSIDVSLKSIDHTIVNEMMNEPVYQQFFDRSDTTDVALHYRVAKRLHLLKQELPMVESLYLVRYKDELIFNGNLIQPIIKSADSDFIQAFKARQGLLFSKWSGLRKHKHFALQDYKDVVSLVRTYPLTAGEQGLFVVNVSKSSLQSMVETITDTTTVFVNLYDAEGNPMIGDASEHGKDAVLTRMTSSYTGWTIESGLNHGAIVRRSSLFFDLWFMLGLLVFVLGIVSIVYVTRRNYKPLKELIAKIDSHLRREQDEPESFRRLRDDVPSDEFGFLRNAVDNFIAKSEEAGKQFEEAALLKKKSVFRDLIDGAAVVEAELSFVRGVAAPVGGFDRLAVVVAEIDGYDEVFRNDKERDRTLYKFVLGSVMNEMLGVPPLRVWLEWIAEHRIAGIVFLNGEEADPEETCEQICEWVRSNLKFTVTVGLGLEYPDWSGVCRSYKEADRALQYKPVLGAGRLLTTSTIEVSRATESADATESIQTIHELAESFRRYEDDWPERLKTWFVDMRDRLCTRDDILILIHYFIYYLDLQISQLPKEVRATWKGKALSDMLDAAKRLETLDRTERELRDILDRFARLARDIREDKSYHAQMKKIRSYLEEHYANPDLSLDYLSDKFEINPKYLSQLFKEEFGENFLDFLMRKRIEEAKRILLLEDRSIQDIGDRVGYPNATTFRRVFKKVVGISPVDYRRQSETTQG